MSLSQLVVDALECSVSKFIKQVSSKHGISEDELTTIWSGKQVCSKPKTAPPEGADHSQLLKLSLKELQALCKDKDMKHTGTKIVLARRISGEEVTPDVKPKAAAKNVPKVSSVVEKLKASVPTVNIRRNQFDNYEHPETSFVFDFKTKKVIGKQNDDGSVEELTSEDIDTCNKYNFQVSEIPSNLDKKTSLEDVVVDELEESDDDLLEETILDDGDIALGSDEEYEYEEEEEEAEA
jgi:hypothetical protein